MIGRRQGTSMMQRYLVDTRPVEPESPQLPRWVPTVLRFLALIAVSAGLGAGIALLVAHFEGWPLARSAAIGLYFVAGAFVVLMCVDAGPGPADISGYWIGERNVFHPAYLLIALILAGLGYLIQFQL